MSDGSFLLFLNSLIRFNIRVVSLQWDKLSRFLDEGLLLNKIFNCAWTSVDLGFAANRLNILLYLKYLVLFFDLLGVDAINESDWRWSLL